MTRLDIEDYNISGMTLLLVGSDFYLGDVLPTNNTLSSIAS